MVCSSRGDFGTKLDFQGMYNNILIVFVVTLLASCQLPMDTGFTKSGSKWWKGNLCTEDINGEKLIRFDGGEMNGNLSGMERRAMIFRPVLVSRKEGRFELWNAPSGLNDGVVRIFGYLDYNSPNSGRSIVGQFLVVKKLEVISRYDQDGE